MNIFKRLTGVALFAASAAVFAQATPLAAPQPATSSPDVLIRTTFEDAKATVRQTQDPKKLRAMAEQKLLPYFDFAQMTRLAVGPGWRSATPEQQKALTDAFRALLVNTYTSALHQASSILDKQLEVKPVQKTADKDVIVRTIVSSPNKPPLSIDYRMVDNGQGWKVYDVVVEGVSLVTTYRGEFSEQVRRDGVAGLIKTLEEKNRTIAAR
jgi:phospholipid transport system substrate-binding protein